MRLAIKNHLAAAHWLTASKICKGRSITMKQFRHLFLAAASIALAAFAFPGPAGSADKPIHITLITKDPDNHFWTAMVESAKKEAANYQNVEITVEAGRDQTDADGQIRAIEY